MKTTYSTALAARCAAFNATHAEINRLAPLYRAAFSAFHGQHVTTAAGDYLAKIRKTLPAASPDVQIYSPHVGCFVVKTWATGGNSTHYAEAYFYAFSKAQDGTAEALKWEFEPYRTDFSPESVQAARAVLKAAKDAVSKAESAVAPFGEFDR